MKNTPIKRIPKEKVAVLHVCSQERSIDQLIKTTDKLSVIITGNGNPTEGYVYKVLEMGKQINDINIKLTGISGIVSELHEKSVTENAIEKNNSKTWGRWIQIIGTTIALGMLLLGYLNLTKQSKSVEKRIDNIGIPFVTNSRGEILSLPDSTKIIYFSADSLSYSIKKDK
jgi:hypothetical protein